MAMRSLLSPVSVSVTLRMESTRGATRCFYASKSRASCDHKHNDKKKSKEEEAEEKKKAGEDADKKSEGTRRHWPKIFKPTS